MEFYGCASTHMVHMLSSEDYDMLQIKSHYAACVFILIILIMALTILSVSHTHTHTYIWLEIL